MYELYISFLFVLICFLTFCLLEPCLEKNCYKNYNRKVFPIQNDSDEAS